jgi:hypothetical protein
MPPGLGAEGRVFLALAGLVWGAVLFALLVLGVFNLR